ncbi:MAG: MTH1187 family thiamine-binding protein [Candidatus Ranarchaeia archaeon]
MTVIAEIMIAPLCSGSGSLTSYVAKVVSSIKQKAESLNAKWELTSMGTIVETGTFEDLIKIFAEAYNAGWQKGIRRVFATLKIDAKLDYRRERMNRKVLSVLSVIGQEKNTV